MAALLLQAQPLPISRRLNQLLRTLPEADFQALARHLEPVHLRLGESIYEPGRRLAYAFFPTTSIVSLHYVTESGASAETASVGNEGMVGMALFMGGDTTTGSARVLLAGDALRLPAAALKSAFESAGPLRRLLLRHAQMLITQISQVSVCNRHHAIEQQFCRWMLTTLDRAPSQELVTTHDLVAHTLGVRRESITEAAVRLQQAGVIRYRRGHIAVLDRAGLEQRSCECYGVMRKELSRLVMVSAGAPGRGDHSADVDCL